MKIKNLVNSQPAERRTPLLGKRSVSSKRCGTPQTLRERKFATLLVTICLLLAPALVAAQGLDPASLLKPLSDSWPTYSGDYSGRRYSSLAQINQSNVKNLTLAWTRRLTNGPNAAGTAGAPGVPALIIGGEGPGDIVAAGATQIKGAVLQVN